MADNLTFTAKTATAPRGTVVRTREVGGAHVQMVEVFGARGSFGELRTAHITPRALLTFHYGLTSIMKDNSSGSGSLTFSNSMISVNSGAATSSVGAVTSRRVIDYQPGMGVVIRFTAIFTTGVDGNEQIIGIGDASNNDGLYFGYNGTSFGILRIVGGTKTWVPQASWNHDKADGTGGLPAINFTKGNVFEIKYQWLGFGAIEFFIEEPSSGEFIPVHTIEYANSNTTPSLLNPSLPLRIKSENTTNNTNVVVKSGSMGGFIEGGHFDLGAIFSISGTNATVGSTETNILTIRNKTTFGGVSNRIHLTILEFGGDADGTKNVTIRLRRNATLGATPTWIDIDTTNSCVDYNVLDNTASGGVLIKTLRLGKTESKDIDTHDLDIELFPGETLTISGATDSSTSDLGASVTWRESL